MVAVRTCESFGFALFGEDRTARTPGHYSLKKPGELPFRRELMLHFIFIGNGKLLSLEAGVFTVLLLRAFWRTGIRSLRRFRGRRYAEIDNPPVDYAFLVSAKGSAPRVEVDHRLHRDRIVG